jgi:hypothetical protein
MQSDDFPYGSPHASCEAFLHMLRVLDDLARRAPLQD